MPLTPFHWGPAVLVGLILLRYIDFPTFLIANVIVDVEPILVLTFQLDYPLHGFFHSLFGGTLVAIALTLAMAPIRPHLSPLLSVFKLEHKPSTRSILLAALTGVYLHILLDARMHQDIQPLYPLNFNPLLDNNLSSTIGMYMVCIWSGLGGLLLYGVRCVFIWRKSRNG